MKRVWKILTVSCLLGMFGSTISVYADVQISQHPVALVTAQEDYENIAVSQVTDYVNIREQATTDSNIVGKIYNNCAATILETVDGEGGQWYRIQSGTVNGYMKAQYFITGQEAVQLAQSIGREFVTINTASLRLRAQPDLNSEVLTMLSSGARYVVQGEEGDFFKVEVDADLVGYIAKQYCKTTVEFDQAVSLEEERQKLAEEEARKQEAKSAMEALEQVIYTETGTAATGDSNTGAGGINVGQLIIAANPLQADNSPQATAPPPAVSGGADHQASGNSSGNSSAGGSASNNGNIAANPLESTGDDSLQVGPPPVSVNEGSTNNSVSSESSGSTTVSAGTTQAASGPGQKAIISATRTAIVAYAKQFLGNPYVYGGTSLTNGTDCSGFTQGVYKHFGITTGRTSRDQAANGKTIAVSAVQPGDLLFYASGNYINHVALYIGDGKVIHASNSTTGIIISPYNYRTPYKAVTFLD
ncbi:MAG: NlpC/P60 family protein [Brotaphodocola sp.]